MPEKKPEERWHKNWARVFDVKCMWGGAVPSFCSYVWPNSKTCFYSYSSKFDVSIRSAFWILNWLIFKPASIHCRFTEASIMQLQCLPIRLVCVRESTKMNVTSSDFKSLFRKISSYRRTCPLDATCASECCGKVSRHQKTVLGKYTVSLDAYWLLKLTKKLNNGHAKVDFAVFVISYHKPIAELLNLLRIYWNQKFDIYLASYCIQILKTLLLRFQAPTFKIMSH